jgi:hypothetical protein
VCIRNRDNRLKYQIREHSEEIETSENSCESTDTGNNPRLSIRKEEIEL